MDLPVMPPLAPMLAKAQAALPVESGWLFEPKWDGFRCIAFRDGDEVVLGSRNERPLTRYFPDMVVALRDALPDRCVVDGELVVPRPSGEGLDFDALQQRIHPADSRVQMLARQTPAAFVAFDLLAISDEDLRERPLLERRQRLDRELAAVEPPVYLTPWTTDHDLAQEWFKRFEGAGLDGIVAKPLDGPYTPGVRTLVKVKHQRTADCVVAGFRWHKDGKGVGSLLLGLFDDAGQLHHVGVCAGFSIKARAALVDEIAPLRDHALDNHPWKEWAVAEAHAHGRLPGAVSRWNATKDLSWEPLRPERVAEVAFSQLQGDRFRHGTSLVRWRPDRDPSSCRYDQLEVAEPVALSDVLVGGPERGPAR